MTSPDGRLGETDNDVKLFPNLRSLTLVKIVLYHVSGRN